MDINVSKGQGITQAIAANLGLNKDDCKGIKLSTWQSVMTLVDEENTRRLQNNQSSIFSGGNDVSGIGNKSSWKNNFHVNAGDVLQLEDSVYNKIKELLTGKKENVKESPKVQNSQEQSKTQVSAASEGEDPVSAKTENSVESEAAGKSDEASQEVVVNKTDSSGVKAEETVAAKAPSVQEASESENFKLGQKLDMMFKEMGEFDENGKVKDISVDITDGDWRKLAGKKDKTDEENKFLDTEYKSSVKNLGLAYHTYIDKKYGNNDGYIDKSEYSAYEAEGIPEELKTDEEAMSEIRKMTDIGFNRLDLNKDSKIDYEELSAYIHAMDFGTEDGKSNGLNGKISAFDFMVNSLALSKAEKSSLDEKLAYAYKALFGKKAA